MNIKERVLALRPTGKKRRRIIVTGLLCVCLLFCGFIWTWVIEFTASVFFSVEEAVDEELIVDFNNIVNVDDLQVYLNEPVIAEQILTGVQANLSADAVYDFEIPEMREESLGSYIIRTIFDRLFT